VFFPNMFERTGWKNRIVAADPVPFHGPEPRLAGPARRTLELLPNLAAETLLVQMNDRTPQRLYPKLDDRGYDYATVERAKDVVTVSCRRTRRVAGSRFWFPTRSAPAIVERWGYIGCLQNCHRTLASTPSSRPR
jgi:hypothetical protein